MRFICDETAGNGKNRFVFHIGRDESRLLVALVQSASKYTPRLPETTQIHARLNQMNKEFLKTLNKE